jgi:hypothetical protein
MQNSTPTLARIFLLIGLLAFAHQVRAQGFDPKFDEDCNPVVPTIPAQCQSLADKVEALTSDLSLLQADLINFPNSKAETMRKIKALELRIKRAITALEACEMQNAGSAQGRVIAPSELDEIFNGTAVLRTSYPRAAGPFFQPISVGLRFSRNRCAVTMTSFPPISVKVTVPVLGQVTISITRTGGGVGQYHPVTGRMILPLKLHFSYPVVSDDDIWFDLTTGSSVSPGGNFNLTGMTRQSDGSIRLVGTSTFTGGFLQPNDGALEVTGRIIPVTSPGPLPPQCQKIADEIDALEQEITALQEQLTTAPPTAKPQLLQQIRQLQAELAKKRLALKNCK